MTTKYKVCYFVFNSGKFASDCRHALAVGNLTVDLVADVAGLSDTTIMGYLTGQVNNMKMQHFLAVCNALDLNPLNYFDMLGAFPF